nr:excinuclease ABC subunit UvrC [Cytophagales bacterium]
MNSQSSIETGIEAIRSYLKSLPASPGVYHMISANDEVLYVGKAKALKNRVSSYTNFDSLPIRIKRMVSMTRRMEFITTHTEADALILEASLIKKFKPRFNILLRDDKSFPYILIREDHDFPQIMKFRGSKKTKGKYFGPFPSAGDVNRTIAILQRAFLLRNCSDHYFANRTRPCLQYHIKRCTAPCVGKVSKAQYAEQVEFASDFMEGRSRQVQKNLTKKMQNASENMDYELAAQYRDRIKALTSIQSKHEMNFDLGNCDVVALVQKDGVTCIQVFFYRSAHNLGSKSYFPRHHAEDDVSSILSAFLAQFYQTKPIPHKIVLNHDLDESVLLAEALEKRIGHRVDIKQPKRGKYRQALDFAEKNARNALDFHLAQSSTLQKMRDALCDLFDMEEAPKRIEVYDNSHISGTNMVGAMIVEGEEGFQKNAYRKFNIKTAKESDDYGMMREVLTRRFKKTLENGQGIGSENWPDLLLIDGGLGQLNACLEVLEDLGIKEHLTIVSIAKGEDRNAGREKFFMPEKNPFQLPVNDPVLHYLQRLRDEAHRFVVGAHQTRRQKSAQASPLDDVKGIGAKRKKALLLHFGSAKAVKAASIKDLMKVEGISQSIAEEIYSHFHDA